jgi:hypothetical protein
MTDYSTKFREEFKNAKPEQLLEMLIIANRHCYERAEIIKDAYNVMASNKKDEEFYEVTARMEKVLEGFMIDKPY